jgi:hypothetical protein
MYHRINRGGYVPSYDRRKMIINERFENVGGTNRGLTL